METERAAGRKTPQETAGSCFHRPAGFGDTALARLAGAVALSACLAGSVFAAAGRGRIEGVVMTADGSAAAGAKVRIQDLGVSTMTDSQGHYVLVDLPPGREVTLIVQLNERLRQEKVVEVVRGTRVVDFLFEIATRTEAVEVAAEIPLMQASDQISGVSLSPEQMAVLPSLGETDIFRSLQLLPGVSGSHESSSGLYVRGGVPSQNLISYDGFTVYHVDHLYGYFTAFNMDAVDQVRLSKSAFDPRDGGRLAGVLDLTGKTGRRDRPGISLGLSLLSAHAVAETPLGSHASLLVSGRRSFQGPLYNSILDLFGNESSGPGGGPGPGGRGGMIAGPGPGGPGGGFALFQTEPSSYFYDSNAKLLWEPSAQDHVSLSLYLGRDVVDNSRSLDIPEELRQRMAERGFEPPDSLDLSDTREWNNRGAGLQWRRSWGRGIETRASLGYSSFKDLNDRASQASQNESGNQENNDLGDTTVRLELTAPLRETNVLEAGLVATRNKISYTFENNSTAQLRPDFADTEAPDRPQIGGFLDRDQQAAQYSGYVLDRWVLGKVTLSPGLRFTRYDATSQTFAEPRVSAQAQLTDRLRVKGAWGVQHQFANRIAREDIQSGDQEFWTLSDGTDVPVARARQGALGMSYETHGFLVDVETFHKQLDGLALFAPQFGPPPDATQGVPDLQSFFYQGEETARGAELLVQKKFGSHTGWLSYTFSEVEDRFPDLQDDPFPASQDQRHELKLVDSVRRGPWTFSGAFVLASGAPYTEAVAVESTAIGEEFVFDRLVSGTRHAARLPAYQRLDLAVHYEFPVGPGKGTLGVSGFNVYDHTNVWYREFQVVQGEIIANDVVLMGRTVNAFFNLRF